MAESSSKFDRPSSSSSSSSSSGDVSVTVEKDVSDENGSKTGGEGADVDNRESVGGSVGITDSSGTPAMELTRVNTLPPEILTSEKPQSPSHHLKLERSKTETPTHSSGFAQAAAKIFDNKISEQQKAVISQIWNGGLSDAYIYI